MKNKGDITRGRPTKLTQDKIELAIRLRERGFPIAEIAQALGVTEQLLYLKNSEWEQLRKRLNIIKEKQELERLKKVEHSLYDRAIGYKTKEKRELFDGDGNKTGEQVTTREVTPDVKAQMFYLANRDPDNWKLQPGENNTQPENETPVIKLVFDNMPEKKTQ